jgi:VWFA-related protein
MPSLRSARRILIPGVLLLAFSAAPRSAAEKPAAVPVAPGVQRERVFLVLLDVVVTDSSGHPLLDLRPEEFRLTVDGHLVPIRSVELQMPGRTIPAPPASPSPLPAPGAAASASPAATTPATPSDLAARPRGIVLFFDGLNSQIGLRPEAIESARRFLKEGLQEGDEVMVIGMGHQCRIYRTFTTDISLVLAALDEVEKDPGIRMGGENQYLSNINELEEMAKAKASPATLESMAKLFVTEDLRRGSRLTAALQALAESLRTRPGRKEVYLFSDGMAPYPAALYGIEDVDDRNQERELLQVAEQAGASQMALNAVNTLGLTAGPPEDPQVRLEQYTTMGLSIVALNSGGVLTHGVNSHFERPLRKIEQQTRATYLLSYEPRTEPDGKIHPVRVSVTRKGARVRAPQGSFWMTEEQRRTTETVAAYIAPDLYRKIPLALEATSYLAAEGKSSVEVAVALPRSSLVFVPQENRRVARLEAGLVLQRADRTPEEPIARTLEVRLPAAEPSHPGAKVSHAGLKEGASGGGAHDAGGDPDSEGDLVLLMRRSVPPGEYQATVVVRDLESGEVGALREPVKVPDLASDHLAMSSVILSGSAAMGKVIDVDPSEKGVGIPLATPSVRRIYSPGEKVVASALVYHPRRDPATGEIRITGSAQIRRKGEVIRHFAPAGHTLPRDSSTTTLTLTLPVDLTGLDPGVYQLEVEAWDEVDRRGILQTVDFLVR